MSQIPDGQATAWRNPAFGEAAGRLDPYTVDHCDGASLGDGGSEGVVLVLARSRRHHRLDPGAIQSDGVWAAPGAGYALRNA